MTQTYGSLDTEVAGDRPDLLAPSVANAIGGLPQEIAAGIRVAEIDPGLADTAAMTDAYDVPLTVSANCVVVSGRRGGEQRIFADALLEEETAHGEDQRDISPGDRSAPSAAVRLQHVAVDDDLPLTERGKINDRAE